jgi:sulfur-oxidizing protein SoxA
LSAGRLASTLLAGAGLLLLIAAGAPQKRSGYLDASPETRAMQDEDASNPGFLWVQQGEALWSQRAGSAARSCADCHGGGAVSMRGVAVRYPVYDARLGRPITLAGRIEQCRVERQGAPPLQPDSDTLLALAAYVGLQSRGMPVRVAADGPAQPFYQAGKTLFAMRQGQLNLSCAQCHDDRAGQRLGGSVIPQGHPNGYPEYRLEWQSLGSLERRIRNCMVGVRAEPFADDSPDMVELELYLAVRSNGLAVETPAVRP